jgi:mannitol/fructose-specific phosphotransferase system IIA component (Ntr-type)
MRLSQIMRGGFFCFEMSTRDEPPEDPDYDRARHVRSVKREAVAEICALFDGGGQVLNQAKLFKDLWNREKRATTAMGSGIAIPHVRTMQARSLVLGFSRSDSGLSFDAPDGRPVQLFFSIIGPRHEEAAYLRIYREIALIFSYPNAYRMLMEASSEWEVLRVLDGHLD